MKNLILLTIVPFVLNACTSAIPTLGPNDLSPTAVELPTQTFVVPTQSPELQQAASETATPQLASTLSATVTPTFDPYFIVTATHSPAEVCPKQDSTLPSPDFYPMLGATWPLHLQQDYLDFFNAGGTVETLSKYSVDLWDWSPDYVIDLTNDGIPEYVLLWGDVVIYGCHSGQYQILLNLPVIDDNGTNDVLKIRDANLNGIPELILRVKLTQTTENFDVVEWDGTRFRSLFYANDRNINNNSLFDLGKGRARFNFEDSDRDPLLELAVEIFPPHWDREGKYENGFPWRREVDYYKWNGNGYVFSRRAYSPPTFRFQAVNDGDWAFIDGDYKKAISFYQQAISDNTLLWYTNDRRKSLLINEITWRYSDVTPPPLVNDPNEYPNIAAYAYFRMMLAEIKLEKLSSAKTTYEWLQMNFSSGKSGHVYAELANIFWKKYQVSKNFAQGCSATYEYSINHLEEVFRYISSEVYLDGKKLEWSNPIQFGEQNSELKYGPEMICPSN